MSWDEALFSLAWTGARRLLTPRPGEALLKRRLEVEPERERLEVLASLLCGAKLKVMLTADLGGLQGDVLFLPRFLDFAPSVELNMQALLIRVAWACSARRLGAVVSRAENRLLATALWAPRIRARLLDEAPRLHDSLLHLERVVLALRSCPADTDVAGLAIEATVRLALGAQPDASLPGAAWEWATAAHQGVCAPLPHCAFTWRRRVVSLDPVPLWSELLAGGPIAHPGQPHVSDALPTPGITERQKKVASRVERLTTPADQLAENPLVHSFEKIRTLETYKGGSKRIDGDDELAAHQKALDELDLRQVVRSHQRAQSLYRADVLLDDLVGDFAEGGDGLAQFTYDEWHEGRREWLRQWCRLTMKPIPIAEGVDATLAALRLRVVHTTRELRAVFEQLDASRAWRLRQRQGPDIDIDSVVARYGALKAGHCSEDRVYATRRRHSRDTAILILLDASLSTDGWVANRRVLDVEKEAVIAVGDALEGLFDEVAVAAFCSQSRRDCRFWVAKAFREPWSLGAARLASLEPSGFTRIGPAIRHATSLLSRCGARQKFLLLLSDGKPSDVDRYEGQYGISDVRRAILDAAADGVITHALAMDPASKAWLPAMFGHGRSTVVREPKELVCTLAEVVTKTLRR